MICRTLSKPTSVHASELTDKKEMSDHQHEKMYILLLSREKTESEVKRIHQQIGGAVDNGDRRVHVERLVTS